MLFDVDFPRGELSSAFLCWIGLVGDADEAVHARSLEFLSTLLTELFSGSNVEQHRKKFSDKGSPATVTP